MTYDKELEPNLKNFIKIKADDMSDGDGKEPILTREMMDKVLKIWREGYGGYIWRSDTHYVHLPPEEVPTEKIISADAILGDTNDIPRLR